MEKISPPDFVWVRGCGAWWSLLWNFGGIFKEEHKSKHFADLSPQTSPHTYTTFFTQKLCRTLHRQNFASYLHLATKHVVSMGPYTNMHVHRRKPGNTWTKIKNTFFTLTSFCRNFGLNNEHDKNDDDDDDDDHDDDADGQASNCPNKHHRYPVSSWPNCWGKLPKFLVNQLPIDAINWTEFHGSTSSPRPEHSENTGQKRHAVEAVRRTGAFFFNGVRLLCPTWIQLLWSENSENLCWNNSLGHFRTAFLFKRARSS